MSARHSNKNLRAHYLLAKLAEDRKELQTKDVNLMNQETTLRRVIEEGHDLETEAGAFMYYKLCDKYHVSNLKQLTDRIEFEKDCEVRTIQMFHPNITKEQLEDRINKLKALG